MRVPSIEKQLGIEVYVSRTPGIGGEIRQTPEDFVVEEVLVDGSRAELKPKLPSQVTGDGRYLICLLVKRDWDTLIAARRIAKQLGISERRLRIAGIKDKRAVTAQHISIENIRLKQLRRIRVNDIQVHPLRYSPNMIFPHMSMGNMFHLTVRGISHSATVIQERASRIVDELRVLGGVPNFFGHQRFGTIRPITHLVGRALARNDLEKAALLFLAKPSPHENPQSREARRLVEVGDLKEALSRFPRRVLYERLMLSHLVKHPKDYVNAFRRLPKRLCRLFLQAYQSYLFNRFLSRRLMQKTPINEPHVGDYVVRADSHGLPTHSYVKTASEELESVQEAVRRGEMYVAIPLIGFKQGFSSGRQGEIEQAILESEETTQADFYVSSMPEMSAAGQLRTAIAPITSLRMERPGEDELNPCENKVKTSFFLHRGSYATIVLRELIKPRSLIEAGF